MPKPTSQKTLLFFALLAVFSSAGSANDLCGLHLCDENANCTHPSETLISGCECNAGWLAEDEGSWFDGNCFFEDGSFPTNSATLQTNASHSFHVSGAILQQDAIFACQVVFPTIVQDATLFEIGGARVGLWVGIVDGKFHIQAGAGGSVDCGKRYEKTAYLTTDLFPVDGKAHTLVIDLEFTNEGKIRLWIDSAYIGEGVRWIDGPGGAWAQSEAGAYALATTSRSPVAVTSGWQGAVVSDLHIYSASERVGGCVAFRCADNRQDECAMEADTCHHDATCTDTADSFTCACNLGYVGNGTQCDNVDECATEEDNCDTQASCQDTDGSFTCACNLGYEGSGTAGGCDDEDECALALDNCDANAACNNTAGSFTCTCNAGFQTLPLPLTTSPRPGNATAGPQETPAPFNDTLETSPICVDVDECANTSPCSSDATCTNTEGSFTCTCNAGWESVDDGVTCTDVVDCGVRDNCDGNAACTDGDGSFTCSCNVGFSTAAEGESWFDTDCFFANGLASGSAAAAAALQKQGVSDDFPVYDNQRSANVTFVSKVVFPSAAPDAMLFEIGGNTAVWVGTLNGSFHIQVGISETAVEKGRIYETLAYLIADEFPRDDKNHTIVIDLDLSQGALLRLWIDNAFIASGVPWTSPTLVKWASGEDGQYGMAPAAGLDKSPVGVVTTPWVGDIGSDLLIYSGLFFGGCLHAQCHNLDECAAATHTCDANAACVDSAGSFACACNTGFEPNALGWFDGSCSLDDGTASPALDSALVQLSPGQDLEGVTASGVRQKDVVFACSVVFPSTLQDAMLFEFGGTTIGLWVGILNGRFHIQAGSAQTAVVDGAHYANVAYLITDDFPRDDQEHSVVIALEAKSDYGRTRLWFDARYVGEGVRSTSNLGYWTGSSLGTYGVSTSEVPSGTIGTGWAGAITSELVVYSDRSVGGCNNCNNVDECAEGAHDCHDQSTCTDTTGSFTCQCLPGYQGDGRSCAEIDECILGSHNCHANATCTDTTGSFTCDCNAFFNDVGGDTNGMLCDLDECAAGVDNCVSGVCSDTNGSFTCACSEGYQDLTSLDASACTDIDECAGDHGCGFTGECVNTNGSFFCECVDGWQPGSWFEGACHYKDGSYPALDLSDVAMRTGEATGLMVQELRYSSTIFVCKVTFPSIVEDGRLFVLGSESWKIWVGILDGQFRVQAGKKYEAMAVGAVGNEVSYLVTDDFPRDGGAHTVLIDLQLNNKGMIRLWIENVERGEGVQGNSDFSGWAGSHALGAYGTMDWEDGVGLRGTNTSRLGWPGEVLSDLVLYSGGMRVGGCLEGGCGNVDECLDGLNNCGLGAACNDTVGSFTCTCVEGFEGPLADNATCADIDECAAGTHECDATAVCNNTVGSYECLCPAGLTPESWFEGSCSFVGGGFPDPAFSDARVQTPETSSFDTGDLGRGSSVIFVCRVSFPTTVADGRLFAVGQNHWKFWAGIIDGVFRVQTGKSYGVVAEGLVGNAASYLVTHDFPRDGAAHTVVISYDSSSGGTITLWIDNIKLGTGASSVEGPDWASPAGDGIYGTVSGDPSMRNSNGTTIADGWRGAVLSDLLIYAGRVDACDPEIVCTVNVDECATEQHNCAADASCSDTDGSFECACNAGYEGVADVSCADVDECARGEDQCDEHATCTNSVGSYSCGCNTGYHDASWFEEACYFEDGSFPDFERDPATMQIPVSEHFLVNQTIRENNVIFGCKVVFPTTEQDAMLFEIGGQQGAVWVGVLNGNFHVQIGDEHAVVEDSTWTDTAWVLTDTFPMDGFPHTVLIDVEWRSGGWVRVWLDRTFVGEGRLGFAQRQWASDEGVYGAEGGTSGAAEGVVLTAWNGSVVSDLFLYSNASRHVGGCLANQCAQLDECAAGLHDCGPRAACSDSEGSFTCSCLPGYAADEWPMCGDVDECTAGTHDCDTNARCHNTDGSFQCECVAQSWFEGVCSFADGSYPASDLSDAVLRVPAHETASAEEDIRTSDAIFVSTAVFPADLTSAMLFKIGGSNSMWAGVVNGTFLIRAGRGSEEIVNGGSYSNTAYLMTDAFPRDGLPHTVVIDLDMAAKSQLRLWIDNAYVASGVPWESSNKWKWAGSGGSGAVYGSTPADDPFPVQTVQTPWPGPILSDLIVYQGLVGGCAADAGCVNVDECAAALHDCHASANCSDTAGSFQCVCAEGWVYQDGICVDVVECGVTDDCASAASCQDGDGSFTCTCNVGYSGDGRQCVDVDECGGAVCQGAHEECHNSEGSFSCACQLGFAGSPCVDVDECALGAHVCGPDAHSAAGCVNVNGSYGCVCDEGYFEAGSWLDGLCYLDDGAFPDLTLPDAGATMRVGQTSAFTATETELSRTGDVLFVSKAEFPSAVQDGMLFEVGGGGQGLWVGVLNGHLHVQAGDGSTEVVNGTTYAETSYLITDSFPRDGANHTVLIDIEFAYRDGAGGRIRLWIDSVLIAHGVPWTSASTVRWAGYNQGAYALRSTSNILPGTIYEGWPAAVASDLLIYGGRLMGGCVARECVNLDECGMGGDACGGGLSCVDTDGSFVCVSGEVGAEAALAADTQRVESDVGVAAQQTSTAVALYVVLGAAVVAGVLGVVYVRQRRQRCLQRLTSATDPLSNVCFAVDASKPHAADVTMSATITSSFPGGRDEPNPREPPALEWTRSRSFRASAGRASAVLSSPLGLVSPKSGSMSGSMHSLHRFFRKHSRASADAYDVASAEALLDDAPNDLVHEPCEAHSQRADASV